LARLGAPGEDDDRFWHDGALAVLVFLSVSSEISELFRRKYFPRARAHARLRRACLRASIPHSAPNRIDRKSQSTSQNRFRARGNQFAKVRALPHHKLFVLSVSSI
jgi:hypothetical protein